MAWDVSRRVFLRGAGLAALGVGFAPSPLLVRLAEAAGVGNKVLLHVFLRGGADGLSLLVPYGEPEYYAARGRIALPPPGKAEGVLRIDDTFALHPALAPLKPLYEGGRLAFIPAVGNYDVTRSHFSAQDFVEMGTPGVSTTKTGTLTRALETLPGGTTSKGVAFATRRPISFLGPDPVLVCTNLAAFRLRAKNWLPEAEESLKALYKGTQLARTTSAIFDAVHLLQGTPQIQAPPANGAVYPEAPIGSSLRQAASLIKAGIGTRCIFVSGDGNFDTHSHQLVNNAADFAPLAKALAAFDKDLGKKVDDVVVLVTTEFGRTVFMNGSEGTDHGAGFCAMVLGGRVKGGRIHGRWPGLKKADLFEERDVAVRHDFRDLFAEVAQKHLGIPATAELFPGYKPGAPLGVVA
jgi:uncharacterized protein (DUF1501 family)